MHTKNEKRIHTHTTHTKTNDSISVVGRNEERENKNKHLSISRKRSALRRFKCVCVNEYVIKRDGLYVIFQ